MRTNVICEPIQPGTITVSKELAEYAQKIALGQKVPASTVDFQEACEVFNRTFVIGQKVRKLEDEFETFAGNHCGLFTVSVDWSAISRLIREGIVLVKEAAAVPA